MTTQTHHSVPGSRNKNNPNCAKRNHLNEYGTCNAGAKSLSGVALVTVKVNYFEWKAKTIARVESHLRESAGGQIRGCVSIPNQDLGSSPNAEESKTRDGGRASVCLWEA